jgi:outer membrane PBP1 activator LpoA protein
MSGNIARILVLASVISGLCAPAVANTTTPVTIDAALPVVQQVRLPAFPYLLAQSDLSLPMLAPDPDGAPIVEAVTMPTVSAPPMRIALLLPLHSDSLARVSEAVRAGFMAAYQYEPSNITVNLIETGDSAQDVLSGYRNAVANNDIVVGPLTRSGATAIVQNRAVSKPTIVLTQLNAVGDADVAVPSKMLVMGLSIEDEARQVADWAGANKTAAKAFVISTNASWQRRAARAFAMQWRHLGLQSELMEVSMANGYINANALLQLRNRLQAENPALIFVALGAAQAIQLRAAIGSEIPMYGTSQLNPLTLAEWEMAAPLPDMEGVRLLDMPWQLQADHPAVMAYPRLAQNMEQRHSPDIERLYALGIDAYRVAHNIALQQNNFKIDGVTGKLTVRFGNGPSYFERIAQPAIYRDGRVQVLQPQ